MNQPYFIVVLAHSLHGRLRRIQIPYQFVYLVLVLAVIGGISVMGFVTSYMRITLKVANYNRLLQEVDILRLRYHNLEKESRNTHQQLASLQTLATEVSVAYGFKRQVASNADSVAGSRLALSCGIARRTWRKFALRPSPCIFVNANMLASRTPRLSRVAERILAVTAESLNRSSGRAADRGRLAAATQCDVADTGPMTRSSTR